MNKIVFLLFAVLSFGYTNYHQAQVPETHTNRDYEFPNPFIETFPPFSSEELAVIKQMKVYHMTQVNESPGTIRYYFSPEGRLDSLHSFNLNEKNLSPKSAAWKTRYEYNKQGLVVKRVSGDKYLQFADTIGYEGKRIVYFKSLFGRLSGKKMEFQVNQELHLKESSENGYILADITTEGSPLNLKPHPKSGHAVSTGYYRFNNQNEIQVSVFDYRNDSIAIQPDSAGSYTKTYYMNNGGLTSFEPMRTDVYVNDRIIRSTLKTGQKTTYHYDTQNRLVQVREIIFNEEDRLREGIVYDENGLKSSVLSPHFGPHSTSTFSYEFYPR